MSVSRFSLPRRAEPFLKEVVRETGETAQVCVLNNTQMMAVANADAPWLVRAIGHRGELHSSASGKAFLAFLPRPAQDLLLSRAHAHQVHTQHHHDAGGIESRAGASPQAWIFRQRRGSRTGRALHRRADFRQQGTSHRDAEYCGPGLPDDQGSRSGTGSNGRQRGECAVHRARTSRGRFVEAPIKLSRMVGCLDTLYDHSYRRRVHDVIRTGLIPAE